MTVALVQCCRCSQVARKSDAREVKLYDTEHGTVFGWQHVRDCASIASSEQQR